MKSSLRILHLEDSQNDAELIWATLSCGDISCEPLRLETKEEFLNALERKEFDLILSDCSLPAFDGLSALKIACEKVPEVPFIFVSGTIGEEVAIETLKNGATDYVLKHRLARLVPAVNRALAEVKERQARAEAERSRSEAESLFGVLFDQVTVGVAILGLDGHIVKINPSMHAMLDGQVSGRIEQTGFGGRSLDEFAHPDDRIPDPDVRDELLSGKRTSYQLEQRLIRRDGAIIWGHVVQSVIRGADGAPRFFLNLVEDITERKDLEQKFVHAQKMEVVGRLAAGIAHDFNNFLTVINGYSQMLMGRFAEHHPASHDVHEIQSAGEKAAKLTQRLLALGRPQVQQSTILDLNSIVSGVEDLLRQLAGEKIQLTLHLEPAIGLIEAGREQIEQIILNLCINARDAMPQGGELDILTRNVRLNGTHADDLSIPPGNYVELLVNDTGAGMEAATIPKIFEAFFTTKSLGKGTGLGLWMVHEIVEHSRGAITVDSTPGLGTSFRIYLPTMESRTEASSTPAPSTDLATSSETIMVIEEEQSLRELIVEILQTAGYTVITKPTAAARSGVNLIIRNFAGRAQSTSQASEKQLLLCGSDGQIPEEGVAYLQMPFHRDDLIQRVREVLDAPKGYSIVVADDDRSVRSVLRDVLRPSGFRVLEACGGRQAIAHLHRAPVHLLITDLIMEDQEGLETIQLAKKEFPNVKIIAMSGGFGEQFLRNAKAMGANDVLSKPFRAEAVREMVRRLSLDSLSRASSRV